MEKFYINIYRHGDGYVLGDIFMRHRTREEARKAVKEGKDYVGTYQVIL